MFNKIISAAVLAASVGFAATSRPDFGKSPIAFEANRGQVDRSVRYLSRGEGYSLYLTAAEAVLVFNGTCDSKLTPATVRLAMEGASPAPRVTAQEELRAKSNYLIGADPAQWRTGVPNYARVKYEGVYPGIDVVYYGKQRRLEYDFLVAPGADPSAIRMAFSGAGRIQIDGNGDLVLQTRCGTVRQHRPVIYQESRDGRQIVDGRYVQHGRNQIGFEIAKYDATRPLVIDPILSYATYLGGKGSDYGHGIAVDAAGSAYVSGEVNSSDFPVANALQPAQKANIDVFVTKYAPDGLTLLYSTYLGGSSHDVGQGIAVDPAGNVYLAGRTSSSDFPTFHAIQPALAGGEDGFVAKIDASGSALVYSTYLGGTLNDQAYGIAADAAGNAYITGATVSTNFPVANAMWSTRIGSYDVFVTKINAAGTQLVYSTYLGGTQDDYGYSIAVDYTGAAYVTGLAGSVNFPVVNAPQPKASTSGDAFVTKLDPSGQSLIYSTYLGGGGLDTGYGITADACGFAYVTGRTHSSNFPVTAGVLQGTFAGPASSSTFGGDAFVTRINPNGSTLAYSTYLGGTAGDSGQGIALDRAGNVYVTGVTASANYPTVAATQPSYGGGPCTTTPCGDAFVAKLNLNASQLVYSTFFGGTRDDGGAGIAVDPAGNAYITGFTISTDLPTVNPQQKFRGGDASGNPMDAFAAKISHPLEIAADLSITQSTAVNSVAAGSPLVYTLVVNNNGPATAISTVVTDTLPAGVTFVSATPAGKCSAAGSSVTCNLGDVAAGTTSTLQITVTVNAEGVLQNSASVTSFVPDPLLCNNQTVATVQATAGCTYNLNATSANVGAALGNGTVALNTGNGCAWNAAPDASWLALNGPAAGSGAANIGYSYFSNTQTKARTAHLNVKNTIFTLTQAGSSMSLAERRVTLLYQGFLNREPDPGGLAFWATQDPGNLGVAFYTSDEFKVVSLQLVQLYRAFYGREPVFDTEYLPGVQALRKGAATPASVAASLLAKTEFASTAQLINAMCANVNPGAGAAAVNACVAASGGLSGFAPAEAALKFIGTGAYAGARRDAVYLMYAITLNRAPDQSGFDYWLGVMTANNLDTYWLVTAFVTSPEFQLRLQ